MRRSSVHGWSPTDEPQPERTQRSACLHEQVRRKSHGIVNRTMHSDEQINKNVASFWFRLINTGLCLLQDQSQQVRLKAACFTSTLQHARRGESQKSVYLMQVNRALPLLLDLLLEECWDTPGTLEVLLCNLPRPDLRSVLREASETGCVASPNQHTCANRADFE